MNDRGTSGETVRCDSESHRADPKRTDPWYAIDDVDRIASPAVLVYPDRIEANLQRLIDACGGPHRVRPHVKTHKMPTVVQMQLAMGITRFKASTIAEVEMTAAAGGEDILLAIQPVGPNIGRLIELIQRFPDVNISTIADDRRIIESLASAADAADVRVEVMLDLDVGMHRTGISPDEDALALYRSIDSKPCLKPAGLHIYDGQIHGLSGDALHSAIAESFAPVWQLRDRLLSLNLPVPHIVAGGTPTSHHLSQHEGVEVGAGTVVFWDAGQDDLSPDLGYLPAAVLLTRVISRPQHDLLCIDLGHKAVASEMRPPRVSLFELPDAETVTHSEEHLVVRTSHADRFPVGSVLFGLPKHICPTIALHAEVGVVQDRRLVDQWGVVARDRKVTI